MATIALLSRGRIRPSCHGPATAIGSPDDILLVRTGGHFAGGTVMHWRAGAEGRGALLTGDVAMVAMDRRSLSFMYSFPNYIPLNATAVRRIWAAVEPLAFDRIYGAWWGRNCRRQCQGGVRDVRPAVYRGDLGLKARGPSRLVLAVSHDGL